MAWSATERYGLDVAPGEFALVQDFLNTIAEGSTPPPDLLATLESARSWAMSALEAWGASGGWPHELPELDEASRKHLVKFRTALFISLFGADAGDVEELRAGELDRVLGRARWTARAAGGHVELVPAGVGWQHIASSLLLICYRGHIAGELKRLKTCRSRQCNVVFFDRSPNNSAVWHDVRVCGNRENVRAYRQRVKARS